MKANRKPLIVWACASTACLLLMLGLHLSLILLAGLPSQETAAMEGVSSNAPIGFGFLCVILSVALLPGNTVMDFGQVPWFRFYGLSVWVWILSALFWGGGITILGRVIFRGKKP